MSNPLFVKESQLFQHLFSISLDSFKRRQAIIRMQQLVERLWKVFKDHYIIRLERESCIKLQHILIMRVQLLQLLENASLFLSWPNIAFHPSYDLNSIRLIVINMSHFKTSTKSTIRNMGYYFVLVVNHLSNSILIMASILSTFPSLFPFLFWFWLL
jgi:hypothetical protein